MAQTSRAEVRCPRCGVVQAVESDVELDWCANCSTHLCDDCMDAGCCGKKPADSGWADGEPFRREMPVAEKAPGFVDLVRKIAAHYGHVRQIVGMEVTTEVQAPITDVAPVHRLEIAYEGDFTPEENAALTEELEKCVADPGYTPTYPAGITTACRGGKLVFVKALNPADFGPGACVGRHVACPQVGPTSSTDCTCGLDEYVRAQEERGE